MRQAAGGPAATWLCGALLLAVLVLPVGTHGASAVPDLPVDVYAVSGESGTGVVTFHWDSAADTYNAAAFGPPRFLVTATPVNATGTPPPPPAVFVSSSPAYVAGLTNGHAYTFAVEPHNGAGESAAVGAVATAPVVIAAPARVGSVTTIPLNRSVTVVWDAAVSRAAPVGVYIVTVTPPHSAPVLVPGANTTASVHGLTNGVGYHFTVVARNEFGDSSATSTSSLSFPQCACPRRCAAAPLTTPTLVRVCTAPRARRHDTDVFAVCRARACVVGVTCRWQQPLYSPAWQDRAGRHHMEPSAQRHGGRVGQPCGGGRRLGGVG